MNFENTQVRKVSKLFVAEGYICCKCREWIPVWFTTNLLEESLIKLNKMHPFNTSYRYHFGKILKRAEEVQRKGMSLWLDLTS